MTRQVYVQPGEIHWSEVPCEFRTVLGSCVSVCLWDPVLTIGGLNHFVLPATLNSSGGTRSGEGWFGDAAIPRLIALLMDEGCRSLVAKVFGGAAVLPIGGAKTVGDGNAKIAMSLLHKHGIPVIARRTGGTEGVALRYSSETGAALLRRVGGSGDGPCSASGG